MKDYCECKTDQAITWTPQHQCNECGKPYDTFNPIICVIGETGLPQFIRTHEKKDD